jgi:hypothetical protein
VNPSLIRQTLENPSFHRVRILWIKTGHRNNQQKKQYRKRMGKKNPKKTQRTIPAIKSTMSCSKIHTDQKKRSTKRVSCFEILIANPEYKTPTHTHLRHMKRSSIQEIEHIPIRAGKSLPGFHLFFFPPTQPRVFSLPKVSPNFSEIRSQLRLRATFFISTPEFLRRCSWFPNIITTDEKDRSRGPGRTRLPDN